MKNNKLISVIALIIVILLAVMLGYGYFKKHTYKLVRPLVTMEIEGYGTIKMELYPDMAPNTVKNFVKLINEGYYNGLTFHRVEETLIQGGDTAGDGSGKTEYAIKGEFLENGYDNTLKFERGTVGLARQDFSAYASMDSSLIEEGYNSGCAQFFIMAQDVPQFDGYYTAFGKITEGMEIVDEITKLETAVETDEETGEKTTTTKPVNPPVISNITVETYGVEYGEPETNEVFDINTWFMKKYYGL